MKITDEMIQSYCERMGYKLTGIGKIAFSYIKPNGDHAALLKAAATPNQTIAADAKSRAAE